MLNILYPPFDNNTPNDLKIDNNILNICKSGSRVLWLLWSKNLTESTKCLRFVVRGYNVRQSE